MAEPLQGSPTSFLHTLEAFKANLSDNEKRDFQLTTLDDLKVAIKRIQNRQASERRLQGMKRLERFLEAMAEYDKVIRIFANSTQILAFVWGPMKFLLQIASTFSEAFDTLLDAYEQIGEHMPLLIQYQTFFQRHPQMSQVLRMMYQNILEFHLKAMRYFKQRMWKQLFHALWKNFKSEFESILENMRRQRDLIHSQTCLLELEEIVSSQRVTNANLESIRKFETHQQYKAVYQWLSAASCETDQENHAKVRSEYPDTGLWLFRVDKFKAWFNPDLCSCPVLWLCGIPGAGKTVLSSLIVTKAREMRRAVVGFFYCKYRDPQRNSFLAVARGILSQLLVQNDILLPLLYEKASKSGEASLSSVSLAQELLDTALKNCNKVYIILDGIDECRRGDRKLIATIFQDIQASLPVDDADTVRCIFISQDDGAARKDFLNLPCFKITSADNTRDIELFTNAWCERIKRRFELSDDREAYILSIIIEKADGMFLFAKLMTRYLLDQTSLENLDTALEPESFPQGPLRLEEAYSRVVRGIFEQDGGAKSFATTTLLEWLICAKRPLRWLEIQGAISIDIKNQHVDWAKRRIRDDPKKLCGSLVEVCSDDVVDLVHHTAKRYLVDKNFIETAAAELRIALLCIEYLSYPAFEVSLQPEHIEYYDRSGYYGFFDYAFAYWAHHLEKGISSSVEKDAIQHLSESVGIFIDSHWTAPLNLPSHSQSLTNKLQRLSERACVDRLACAIAVAKKQLSVHARPSSFTQVLDLHEMIKRVRKIQELSHRIDRSIVPYSIDARTIFKCPRVNCMYFYAGFTTKPQRDSHVAKHDRSFFCSYSSCSTSVLGWATAKDLRRHEAEYHGAIASDEEGEFPEAAPGDATRKTAFKCPTCDITFTRKHNLNLHVRRHEAPGARLFACTICGEEFARPGDRARHNASMHSNKSFTCDGELKNETRWGCGRQFKRLDGLIRHFRSDRGKACVKPLLEKEAEDMEKEMASERDHSHSSRTEENPGMSESSEERHSCVKSGNGIYPAALLALYPVLAHTS